MSEIITDQRRGWTSASNALSDKLCAGRHGAQRGIPEPPRDEDATSGQLIHMALADSGDHPLMEKLTLEQREVFDACRKIEKATADQFFGNTKDPMRVFRHKRFWVRIQKVDRTIVEHSGEADVVYRAGTRLLVMDYKTLAGEVEDSPRNLQLRDLAVLAWGELAPITEVATAIVQPFVTHTPEVCVYTAEDLTKAFDELCIRVVLSNDPKAKRVAGEAQCKFCLAATNCVERQQWAGQMAHPALSNLLGVPIVAWTPAQRAAAADALGPAFDLLEDIKKALKEGLAKDPAFVVGYVLAPGNKRETITNPQECFTRFAAKGGTLEQFMACISVGKTKLKEQVHTVTQAKGIALEKEMQALTVGITDVAQNAPSLKKVKG